MIDDLLGIIAPHYCCGCGRLGSLLCDNCKYDIVYERHSGCVICGQIANDLVGVCSNCQIYCNRAWCVASRQGPLQILVDKYKFDQARSAYRSLASLLNETLPELPSNTIVVGVPTIPGHVRQRGYDHVRLVAHQLARTRALDYSPLLDRLTYSVQKGASRKEREAQAKAAFICRQKLDSERTYLLIDDVVTTGATLRYAALALRKAGAHKIYLATICRQPLD